MLTKNLFKKSVVILAIFLVFGVIGCKDSSKKKEHEHEEHAGHEEEHGIKQTVTISDESQKLIELELAGVTYRTMEETFMVTGELKRAEPIYKILADIGSYLPLKNHTDWLQHII